MSDNGKLEKPTQSQQDKKPAATSSAEAEAGGLRAGAGFRAVLDQRTQAVEGVRYRATGGAAGIPPAGHIAAERREIIGGAAARIMRKQSGAASGGQVPQTAGAPLGSDVRAKMENKLGADLSAVRVHMGSESAQAATGFGARAFTVGNDIHFNAGQYAPGSKEGNRLLAHELTHVVQGQRSGVQRKAEEGDGKDDSHDASAKVSHPDEPAEKEADAVADDIVEKLDGEDGEGKDDKNHKAEKAGAEKRTDEAAPKIAAKLEPGTIPLAQDSGAKKDTSDPKAKRYIVRAEKKGGKDAKAPQTIQGTREEVVMGLRSLQLAKDEVKASDIVGMGNLAMGSLEVTGTTPAGVAATFNVDFGKAGLQTIFSSGAGASVQGVEIPIYDGKGTLIKPGTPDPELQKMAGQIILTPSGGGSGAPAAGAAANTAAAGGANTGAAANGPVIQVVNDAEHEKFLAESTNLIDNRGYVPTLDKHSEAALWQAVRMEDAKIAAKIKDLGLAKIESVTMKIYSEREMCRQCAAKSAEMMGNLQNHAPATFEAIKTVSKGANLGTEVNSTHAFGGAAPPPPPGQAPHPAAPVAHPPSGNTTAGAKKDSKKA